MTAQSRLCVFDLDGTLCDTAPDLVGALNRVLVAEGLPAARFEEARAFVGHGARVLIERAYKANSIELTDAQAIDLTEQFVAHYADHIADETVLFPHVLEAMETMKSQGWTFAICTNKREGLARQLIETLDLNSWFTAICGGDTFAQRKPDGRHILQTIAQAGGDPKSAIMVGDSAPDVLAAQDADVPVVAVDFGYSHEPIATLKPTALLSSYADLPGVAESLLPGLTSVIST